MADNDAQPSPGWSTSVDEPQFTTAYECNHCPNVGVAPAAEGGVVCADHVTT